MCQTKSTNTTHYPPWNWTVTFLWHLSHSSLMHLNATVYHAQLMLFTIHMVNIIHFNVISESETKNTYHINMWWLFIIFKECKWKCTSPSCKSCVTGDDGDCLATLSRKPVHHIIQALRLLFLSMVLPLLLLILSIPPKKLITMLLWRLSSTFLLLHRVRYPTSLSFCS
jgi:hypothetical protein